MSSLPPIAVVGMACRLPGARNEQEFWELLVSGRDASSEVPEALFDRELYFDPAKGVRGRSYSLAVALEPRLPFDNSKCRLSADDIDSHDPCHLTMCEVASDAFRNAGYDPFDLPIRNAGVYFGHTGGSSMIGDIVYSFYAEQAAAYLGELSALRDLPPHALERVASQIVRSVRARCDHRAQRNELDLAATAGVRLIASAFGLDGPCQAIDAACASSMQAIALGARALQQGSIEMAVVGGASYFKGDSLILFSQAQSVTNRRSCPFDEDADGLVTAEGCVVFVLKTLSRAVADGDRIRCVIRGIGVATDGKGKSLWAPRAEGQVLAIRRAYSADIRPEDIQFIEAHATSTQVGDATELAALGAALPAALPGDRKIHIGAVKGNIGHTLETAGAAGLAKMILAMEHATIPPNVNLDRLNRKVPWERLPFTAPTECVPWPRPAENVSRKGAVNSFGIGGLNVHLVVEEHLPAAASARPTVAEQDAARPRSRAVEREPKEPVAVVGAGVIVPGAQTLEQFRQLLASGRDPKCDAPSERLDARLFLHPGPEAQPFRTRTVRGGFITDYSYDWRRHKVPPKQVDQANPLQFMLLDAAEQAIAQAGYRDGKPLPKERVGVVVGTMFGGDFSNALQMGLRLPEFCRDLRRELESVGAPPETIGAALDELESLVLSRMPALLDETGSFTSSTLASRITKTFDLQGGALSVDAGSGSAVAALNACVDMLRNGDCDVMICAAGQRNMDMTAFEALDRSGALDVPHGRTKNDARTQPCLPGEGCGVLLLKRLSDARRDGDPVLGVIRGIASSFDPEQGDDASRMAVERASGESTAPPDAIVAISEPDATTTEANTLRQCLVQRPQSGPIRSLVPQFGFMGANHVMAGMISAAVEIGDAAAASGASKARPKAIAVHCGIDSRTAHHVVIEHPDRARHGATRTSDSGWESAEAPVSRAPVARSNRSEPSLQPIARLAFVFPGHGSQYPGMLSRLLHESPAAQRACVQVDAALATLDCPPFAALTDRSTHALGVDAWRTQAAILSAEFILGETLRSYGIRPSIVAGHSFGEYAALLFANAWGLTDALRCARIRAEALERGAAPGGMLAVKASEDLVRKTLEQISQEAFVANVNAFDQLVLSGSAEGLSRAAELLKRVGAPSVKLSVPCPFHSPLMIGAQEIMQRRVAEIPISDIRIPLVSTSRWTPVTTAEEIYEGLWRQLTQPVHYVRMLDSLARFRPTAVVEVGPQQVLTKLNRKYFDANVLCVSLDQRRESGLADLLATIAQLTQADSQAAASRSTSRDASDEVLEFDATERRRKKNQRQEGLPSSMPALSLRTSSTVESRTRGVASVFAAREREHAAPARPLAPASGAAPPRSAGLISSPPPVPAASKEALETALVQFVVEQTGYPEEMVDLHADLEAELGIDSIKKAQLFGELGERYQVAPREDLSLDDFSTIAQVRDFLLDELQKRDPEIGVPSGDATLESADVADALIHAGAGAAAPLASDFYSSQSSPQNSAAHAASSVPPNSAAGAQLDERLIQFVVDQTGYPETMVDLFADLEADLGIDSIKKAQLFGELGEYFQIAPREDLSLDDYPTLAHVRDFILEELAKRVAGSHGVAADPAANDALATAAATQSGGSMAGHPAGGGAAAPCPPVEASRSAGSSRTLPSIDGPSSAARAQPLTESPSITPEQLDDMLVQFVIDQTGYPAELVEMEADLEAELGIDSIKKAQLFGELGEHFQIAARDDLSLDDFSTLAKVRDYILAALSGKGAQDGRFPADSVAPQVQPQSPVPIPASPEGRVVRTCEMNGLSRKAGLSYGTTFREAIRRVAADYVDLHDPSPNVQLAGKWADFVAGVAAGAGLNAGVIAALNAAPPLGDPLRDSEVIHRYAEHDGKLGFYYASGAGQFIPRKVVNSAGLSLEWEVADRESGPIDLGAIASWLQDVLTTCRSFADLEELSASHRPPVAMKLRVVAAMEEREFELAPEVSSPPATGAVAAVATPRMSRYALRTTPAPAAAGSLWQPGSAPIIVVSDGEPGAAELAGEIRRAASRLGLATQPVAWGELEQTLDEFHRRGVRPHLVFPGTAPHFAHNGRISVAEQIYPLFAACQKWSREAALASSPESPPLLAAVTRLGGDFGFAAANGDPLGGGVTGLFKAIRREFPQAYVKVVDFAPRSSATLVAERLWEELLGGDRQLEVGFVDGQRHVVEAVRQPIAAVAAESDLPRGGAWIVSGGGRGVTAEVALALGVACAAEMHLLGTTPLPPADAAWRGLDESQLAEHRAQVMRAARESARTPAAAWRAVERAMELDRNLRRFAAAGVAAHYHQCNVADRSAVAEVFRRIRSYGSPLQGVIHGAGVEAACRFERKQRTEYFRTVSVKCDGAVHLMEAALADNASYFIAFGSTSGRFGGLGQTDYSLASDLLAKLTWRLAASRPECRAVCFHWPAWEGIGMAARPESRVVLKGAGMQFMDPSEGARHVLAELASGARAREVLILDTPDLLDTDGTMLRGSLDPQSVAPPSAPVPEASGIPIPLIRELERRVDGSLLAEARLLPRQDVFLVHHQFRGRAMLPAVVIMEMFAQAARRACPDLQVCGFADLKWDRGVVVDDDCSLRLEVRSTPEGADLQCRLEGPGASGSADRFVYARGAVRLAASPSSIEGVALGQPVYGWTPFTYPQESPILHGPPLATLREVDFQHGGGRARLTMPDGRELYSGRAPFEPIIPAALLDGCLVACGLFSYAMLDRRIGIPRALAEYRQARLPRAGERCSLRFFFRGSTSSGDLFDLHLVGDSGETIAEALGYETTALRG